MPIPVAVFAYARPDCLRATLRSLRDDGVPLLYVFSDGAATPTLRDDVAKVREILRAIDWVEVRLVERRENLGLGRSIRAGVEAVLAEQEALVVFEDDLACAPGTYSYFCQALERYRDDPSVLSITPGTRTHASPRAASTVPTSTAGQPATPGRPGGAPGRAWSARP